MGFFLHVTDTTECWSLMFGFYMKHWSSIKKLTRNNLDNLEMTIRLGTYNNVKSPACNYLMVSQKIPILWKLWLRFILACEGLGGATVVLAKNVRMSNWQKSCSEGTFAVDADEISFHKITSQHMIWFDKKIK